MRIFSKKSFSRSIEEIKKERTKRMCNKIHKKLYLNKYNDFYLDNENHTLISTFPFLGEEKMLNDIYGMFPKKLLEEYSPDRIDNSDFWKYVYEHFPILTITNRETLETIEEAKIDSLKFAASIGALTSFLNVIYGSMEEVKVLEIGAGFGNVYDYLKMNEIVNPDKEYYSVDIEKKFNHKNFFKTNGCGLPESLIKLDFLFDAVYCFNVLQHMSYKQKLAYYFGIYDKLKKDGKFIFGIHLETEANESKFGLQDEFGTKYIKFFNQYTPVDKYNRFMEDIKDIGFSEVEIISVCEMYYVICVTK